MFVQLVFTTRHVFSYYTTTLEVVKYKNLPMSVSRKLFENSGFEPEPSVLITDALPKELVCKLSPLRTQASGEGGTRTHSLYLRMVTSFPLFVSYTSRG